MVARHTAPQTAATKKSIETRRRNLEQRMGEHRASQRIMMPSIHVDITTLKDSEVEDECLHLPSDFTFQERQDRGLLAFAVQESRLREGQIYTALEETRLHAQSLNKLRGDLTKNSKGVGQNSRAGGRIRSAEAILNDDIAQYNAIRDAMIRLGTLDPEEGDALPKMEYKDCYIADVGKKRWLGDSRRIDAAPWTITPHGIRVPTTLQGNADRETKENSHEPTPCKCC